VVALVVAASAVGVPGRPSGPVSAATTALTLETTLTKTLGPVQQTTGTGQAWSSPAIGDVTGDGVPEIVVAMLDGTVRAYRTSNHSLVWTKGLTAAIQSSPVLADLNGDRVSEVVVATMAGRVYWLRGSDGSVARTFSEGPPLFCPAGQDCRPHGFFATPTVADIAGDSTPEIIAASWDHTVYAWNPSGSLVFRRYLEDTLWSSPVVADIDSNGDAEIILGGDIWPGNPLGVPAGGLVWALNHTGSTFPGYPKSIPEQTVWSSPAVVDLNRDGDLDIVVGTGGNYADSARSRRIYAFQANNQATLPGWPVNLAGRFRNGVAVGDVDNDNRPEVAVTSEGGYVYSYDGNGDRAWSRCLAEGGGCRDKYATYGGAVIGDVDDDGEQEVVSALDKDLYVLDGSSGGVEDKFDMTTISPSLPALGSDGDGNAIIAVPRGGKDQGDVNRVYVLSTGREMCRADWPMFKKDARRSSYSGTAGPGWRPFDCARAFTDQQYLDFLGRAADASGLRYWSSRLENGSRTGPSVIQEFMDSNEFGRVRSPLVRVYVALTDRAPTDFAAFADQADRFATGTPLEDLADEIVGTPGLVDRDGTSVSGKSRATFVRDTFRFVQGRNPTSAEQQAGENALAGGTSRGTWVAARAEAGSARARLEPEVYVAMTYMGMLGRVPDLGGYDFWVGRVRGGASIRLLISSFQQSSEYATRVA
jgi:hypothetical protein